MNVKETIGKAEGFFAKLPFRAMAEKIPAGVRAKFPLLEAAIPFANQIACGLAAMLVVTVIACSGGGGSGGKEYVVRVPSNSTGLGIRSEPAYGKEYVLFTLKDGDKVTLLEKGKMDRRDDGIEGQWFKVRSKVEYEGKAIEGWAFSAFLVSAADYEKLARLESLETEAREAAAKGDAEAAAKLAKDAVKAAKELQKAGTLDAERVAELETAAETQTARAEAKKEMDAALKSGKAVLAPESDFEVRLNDAGDGAFITKYVGPGGNIIIPATIQGMPVTAVWMNPPKRKVGTGEYNTFLPSQVRNVDDALRVGETTEKTIDANTTLISVVIPEGVWWVGGFANCIALRSVTLPSSLTTVYSDSYPGAFQDCTSLASITIPDGVTTIGERAFAGCKSLASVIIPEGVTTISFVAFSGCTSLTSVTIPEGVTTIDQWAFSDCTSLASIAIPDSVTHISNEVVRGCTSLVTVTISPVKRNFSTVAFSGCPKLSLASQAALKAAGYTGRF